MTIKKTLLVLTGMHRSGTSLLGAIVNSMGINVPGKLIQGDIYNMDGYYEREDIVNIQEDLLIKLGRWWPTTYGCEAMPSSLIHEESIINYKRDLKSIIQCVLTNKYQISAVKDPRISLLLPLWQDITKELGIDIKVIVSIRNPAEVITSLMNRDKRATGMTQRRAEILWYRHNDELISNLKDSKYMLVNYSNWFNKKQRYEQLEGLHQFCLGNKPTKEERDKANACIKYNYRRNNSNIGEEEKMLTNQTKTLYKKLVKATHEKSSTKTKDELIKWLLSMKEKDKKMDINKLWIDQRYYSAQLEGKMPLISLRLHYNLIGWRKTISPDRLFNPNHYKHRAFLVGEEVKGCPLTHFSKYGLAMNIEPNSLTHYKWIKNSVVRLRLFKHGYLEGMHPWAAAAVAVNYGSQENGLKTLDKWIKNGINKSDLKMIMNTNNKHFSNNKLNILDINEPLPETFNVICDSCGIYNWQLYSWIDIISETGEYTIDEDSVNTLYLLIGSYDWLNTKTLIEMSTAKWVYCTNNETYCLLNKLGISAKRVNTDETTRRVKKDMEFNIITSKYGFPNPLNLVKITKLLIIGRIEEEADCSEYTDEMYLPNPNCLSINNTKDARSISQWFIQCYKLGIQLVWISDDKRDIKSKFWHSYKAIECEIATTSLPELFIYPISLKELKRELLWRKQGCKQTVIMNPLDYAIKEEIIIECGKQSDVTVCISLYNYEYKVLNALESIKSQTLKDIDLVIVNDCSSDKSLQKVIGWLSCNSSRFNKVKVVSHTKNLGLSTARNTGFKLADTEWIFVLDADNKILPLALENVMQLTNPVEDNVAAIYSLIRKVKEDKNYSIRDQIIMNFTYWNLDEFNKRNLIDAMALIRKSIWEKVGGYDNIEGGWEDYDFWCKLIENGYYGVLCPQVLAEYNVHKYSMIATKTTHSSRQVSRQLQEKHNWLKLPMANEHKILMEG